MAGSAGMIRQRVNAFPIGNTILFKHYFAGAEVFDRLRPYYNGNQYRFEVPVDEFDSLRRFLRDSGYQPILVDPSEFYVVVRKYSTHPENIFKESVRTETVRNYNCFLMKDQTAVEDAVSNGATRLVDTSLSFGRGSLQDFATASF